MQWKFLLNSIYILSTAAVSLAYNGPEFLIAYKVAGPKGRRVEQVVQGDLICVDSYRLHPCPYLYQSVPSVRQNEDADDNTSIRSAESTYTTGSRTRIFDESMRPILKVDVFDINDPNEYMGKSLRLTKVGSRPLGYVPAFALIYAPKSWTVIRPKRPHRRRNFVFLIQRQGYGRNEMIRVALAVRRNFVNVHPVTPVVFIPVYVLENAGIGLRVEESGARTMGEGSIRRVDYIRVNWCTPFTIRPPTVDTIDWIPATLDDGPGDHPIRINIGVGRRGVVWAVDGEAHSKPFMTVYMHNKMEPLDVVVEGRQFRCGYTSHTIRIMCMEIGVYSPFHKRLINRKGIRVYHAVYSLDQLTPDDI